MQPEQFGRYKILRRLGKGGMAEVFLASAAALDGGERVLALKRLLSPFNLDSQIISMMTDEARLSVWLTHSNIVQVLDFGQVEQSYYLAMEFVGGCDLCDLIRVPDGGIGRPLPPGAALHVMCKVAEALDFAHNRRGPDGRSLGIIHRDVSPHNVLLSTDGEVKVIDFGLARATISLHYSTADVIRGKFSYMPKEQALGRDIDQRIDLFGAGVTMYEALTGVKPYTSNTLAEQIYQLDQPVPPPSALVAELPEEVDHICLRAMAPEPDMRYATAQQFASDLQRALARFTSPGREVEHVAELVTSFIGPEETTEFARMHRMSQDDFPIVDGGVISAELEAVRMASGLADDDPLAPQHGEISVNTLDIIDDMDDEGDTLTEEDDLDSPTMEKPALTLGEAGLSFAEQDPAELAATREHRSLGASVSVGVGVPLVPTPSLPLDDGLDDQATVLAPEEGRRYAEEALGLEPRVSDEDDDQPTIQRSPSEMVAAFDRALEERERKRSAEGKRQRRNKLVMGLVVAAGVVLFGGGFYVGWLLHQGDADDEAATTARARPGTPGPAVPRVAPLPVPVPVPMEEPAKPDAGKPAKPAKKVKVARSPKPRAHRPRRTRPVKKRAPRPAAAPAPAPAAKGGKGFLSVNTDSPARVFIGDRPGSLPAPLKRLPMDKGIHRVRVFFEASKAFSDTQWVSIKPGQTFTLYFSSPAQE